MIGQPSFHRWSDAQCTVNPAEIVVCEVQGDRCFQVVKLFAEPQTESCHSPEKRSHAEVATLHVRRANHLRVRLASDDFWDRSYAL